MGALRPGSDMATKEKSIFFLVKWILGQFIEICRHILHLPTDQEQRSWSFTLIMVLQNNSHRPVSNGGSASPKSVTPILRRYNKPSLCTVLDLGSAFKPVVHLLDKILATEAIM